MITREQAMRRNASQHGPRYSFNNFHAPMPGIPDKCVKMSRIGGTTNNGDCWQIPVSMNHGKVKGTLISAMCDETEEVFTADECPRCHPKR